MLALIWPAQAKADAQNKAAAESLYRAALASMEDGDYQTACPKLVESQKLDPALGTLLYLGECYERLGLTASAWVTFTSAVDAAKRVDNPKRQAIAAERAAQLKDKISLLTVKVPPNVRAKGLEVKRDGVVLGEASWGVAVPVDPGEHTIEATMPGRKAWVKKVIVESGTRSEVTETVPELGDADAPARKRQTVADHPQNAPQQPASPSSHIAEADSGTSASPGKFQRFAGVTLGGVGVVGIAVGTVFGLKAKKQEKDSEAHCWPHDKSRCDPTGVAMIGNAGQYATIANIGFIGGAVAVGGGVLLYLTAPKAARTSALRVVPEISPQRNGVVVEGRF